MRELGITDAVWSVASADASFRRYFRLSCGAKSWIVMDAPPEYEDSRPFVDIAARLREAGLNAPAVLAADFEFGRLLLEDLGRCVYLQALRGGEPPAPLMEAAIDALVRCQARVSAAGLPVYDAALLSREMRLFRDWLCERHLGLSLSDAEDRALVEVERRVLEQVTSQPQVFVHRDYMPRNLMVCEPLPGILDFQDAVLGPYSYDLLSLMRDAFWSWPPPQIEAWLYRYHAAATAAGLPVPDPRQLAEDVDCIGVQRHLKVAGIFARLSYRDGKPQYLADVPRFIAYLQDTARRREAFADLLPLLARIGAALSA